ncbi:MAG: ribonuclease P protein subunit [Methanomassiliicoccales archaeon]|nr:MAG: ribonuclease P protein subunit [Methanomassiliicoccales archaeon]
MSITSKNIHKHELLGLQARIIKSSDKGLKGVTGRIVDETKNTFKLMTLVGEKTLMKKGTVLAVKIKDEEINIDASKLTYRPEDRIKKARRRAVT